MITKHFFLPVLSLLILLTTFVAKAQETQPIGSVIVATGDAYVVSKTSQKRTLERKSNIYLNDRIITGQNGKVQIKLADDSIIIVQANSEFYINDFNFNKNAPKNNRYSGNIIKGALINISGMGEEKNYQLKSPLAVIAFRGTGVATKLARNEGAKTTQEIFVFQGEVSVTNLCPSCTGPRCPTCNPQQVIISSTERNNAVLVSQAAALTRINATTFFDLSIGRDKTLTRNIGGGMMLQCKSRK